MVVCRAVGVLLLKVLVVERRRVSQRVLVLILSRVTEKAIYELAKMDPDS